jgi:hypothetical protein
MPGAKFGGGGFGAMNGMGMGGMGGRIMGGGYGAGLNSMGAMGGGYGAGLNSMSGGIGGAGGFGQMNPMSGGLANLFAPQQPAFGKVRFNLIKDQDYEMDLNDETDEQITSKLFFKYHSGVSVR